MVAVSETLGGKKPWVVELTSSLAEAWGVLVPMPTWADNSIEKRQKTARGTNNFKAERILDYVTIKITVVK